MPRDLADVLHHLLPEAVPEVDAEVDAEVEPTIEATHPAPARSGPAREYAQEFARDFIQSARQRDTAGQAILAVPIGDGDVVRAAFTWNLVVEMTRLGAGATLVAPESDRQAGLWPDEEVRPLGAEITWVRADDLTTLAHGARQVAAQRAGAGVVLTRVPPLWLLRKTELRRTGPRKPDNTSEILSWTLLLTSSERRDLLEAYGLAKRVRAITPDARIGVTVHGAHRQGEAGRAFAKLADVASRRLGAPLASYGLLVDDLQVYRAIVAQRPIGLVHPQSPAARCLHDVAALLLGDARIRTDA